MNDDGQVQRAIAAHAMWKYRLRKAIETGQSEWDTSEVWPDFLCEFGQWLHSLPDHARANPYYKQIHDLHAQFHDMAAQILSLVVEGRTDEADRALALGSPFLKTSAELVLTLVAWEGTMTRRNSADATDLADLSC